MLVGTAKVGTLVDNVTNIFYNEYSSTFVFNYNNFNQAYHFYNSFGNSISLRASAIDMANRINLTPEMIVNGYNVLGVQGNFTGVDVSKVTARPIDVLVGKNYVNNTGNLIEGTMVNLGQSEYYPSISDQTIPIGYAVNGIIHPVTSGIDENITPQNIKAGTSILGILGNYEGSGGANFVMLEGTKLSGSTVANFPDFDASNIQDASYMFCDCYNLVNAPNWNFVNVTNASYMFYCTSSSDKMSNLKYVPNYYMPNVIDTSYMFFDIYNNDFFIENLNIYSSLNCYCMFLGCRNLTVLPDFEVPFAENCVGMFSGCSNLVNFPNLNAYNLQNCTEMFLGCQKLSQIPNINLRNCNNCSRMFAGCQNLVDATNIVFINETYCAGMFSNCYNLVNFSDSVIQKVLYSPYEMFSNCYNLNLKDKIIKDINYANYMFVNCFNLETDSSNISNLILRNIRCANNMFEGSNISSFKDITISNVYYCNEMFYNVKTNFTDVVNITITDVGWNTFRMFGNEFADYGNTITYNRFENIIFNNVHYVSLLFRGDCNKCSNIYITNCGDVSSVLGYVNIPMISNVIIQNVNLISGGIFNSSSELSNVWITNINNCQRVFSDSGITNINSSSNIFIENLNYSSGLFASCKKLKYVNFSGMNFNGIYNATNMFYGCSNLTDAIGLNFYSINILGSTFEGCPNLRNLEILNLSNANGNLSYLISSAWHNNLQKFYIYDMPYINYFGYTLSDCKNLTDVILTNVNNMTSFSRVFINCYNLKNIYITGNFSNIQYVSNMFSNCNNLTDTSINNIINVFLNCSNVINKTLNNTQWNSPFYGSNIDSSRYQSRWSELSAAGWRYY